MNFPFLNQKQNNVVIFRTRQEAFVHYLIEYQKKGIDIDEATNNAFEISEKYAKAMNLPASIEPEEKGIKGILQNAKVITNFINENPTVVEIGKQILAIGLPLLGTAFAGAFAGSALANKTQEPEPVRVEPIVYDDDDELKN